jgi:hypothetical protein
MKSIILFIAMLATAAQSLAQNTFPASGNVGIGTTSPSDSLTVVGNVTVMNNTRFTAGSNEVRIVSGATPQLVLVRSMSVWEWTMGADNKLRLGFSSVPQITLQNGALGLGTDSPLSQLHVAKGDIRISHSTGTSGPSLLLDGTSVGSGGGLWGLSSTTASDLAGAGKLAVMLNGSAKVVVDSSGNVGIGNPSPGSKLALQTSSINDGISIFNTSGGTWLDLYTNLGQGSYNGITASGDRAIIYGGTAVNNTGGGLVIAPWATATTGLRLDSAGNVGIGTASPSYPLSVNGTIQAKEVIVNTGWSDYVFAAGYKLPSLSEVEHQIKTEKHLAGIPSAQEVAEKGISVGQMQAKLLAKIEELTLHQIEQEKRLAAQQEKVLALEARLAALIEN